MLSSHKLHTSFQKDDPQIYSIESPKLENDVAVMEGSSINLTLNASICQTSAAGNQVVHSLSTSSYPVSHVSQQALHAAWQSGMYSSSSSNSSTASVASASNIKVSTVEEGKRTPSVRSVNSRSSSSSENRLLSPIADRKNDFNKLPKDESIFSHTKTYDQTNDTKRYLRPEISISDNNINMHSNLSESPTLSRGSWARLSDHNRQSITLGDFTVLGFDDDSSLDRRPSECSSLNSQPKSMSPLNVSSLWKDVHSRLRATIAATIAAATGNPPSSSEGTPNHSSSLASSVSVQDESLTSANQKAVSLNHISSSADSLAKEKEAGDINLTLHSLPKKREGLSSLPDIPQTFSPDQMSDMATTDSSYDRYGSETNDGPLKDLESGTVVEISGKSPSTFSKASYSSYPEDSTLTASKLDMKGRPYLETFSQNGFNFGVSHANFQSDEPLDLSISSTASAVSPTVRSSIKKGKQKGASPFTDQELVAVMAKSLQGYLRGTPGKSSNPEREGLALTIEDLRISRENSPESHFSKQGVDMQKSHSASSLFHDSTDTSPASSASKMNRAASIAKAEAKLSPNALKQLEVSPKTLSNLSCAPAQGNNQNGLEQLTSHGLKFIMDSYGQASVSSPSTNKSHFSKPGNSKRSIINRNYINHSSEPLETIRRDYKRTNKGYSEHNISNVSIGRGRKYLAENEQQHCRSFESSPGQGLSATDLELSFPQSWTGISYTKKLNVYHSDFHLLQYSRSPFQQKPNKINQSACMDLEAQGYVAGQYVPPLCANIKPDSIERNLDFDRQNSYDWNTLQKNTYDLSVDENIGIGHKGETFKKNKTGLKDMRRGVMKKNMLLEKQTSDILHLRHSQIPGSDSSLTCYHPSFLHRGTDSEADTRQITKRQLMCTETTPGCTYDKLSEDELKKSAKHVADYFSQVLESESFYAKSPNSSNKGNLKIHHRSPLQQLDNAQYLSPGTSSYHKSVTRSDQNWYSRPESVKIPVSQSNCEIVQSMRDVRDILRQTLSYESGQS